MTLEEIISKITELSNRVTGINSWIKSNPNITEPNIYEIMDCNIAYNELLAELVAYYNECGWPLNPDENFAHHITMARDLTKVHPELIRCKAELSYMECLRSLELHPFMQSKAVYDMYSAIKLRQLSGTYQLLPDTSDRQIKRELICKSMSVPFYIWQTKQTEPSYKYDNQTEFANMQEMKALYEASETPCQYEKQLSALFAMIENDYKYAPVVDTSKVAEKK